MKILLLGDFHGKIHNGLIMPAREADIIVSSGDFGSIEGIRNLFLKYGSSFEEKVSPDELNSIRENGLKEGEKILEFLNSFNKKVYIINGNAEKILFKKFKTMASKYKNIQIINHKITIIKNFAIFGLESTFGDTENQEDIEREIKEYKKLITKLKNKKLIFVCHEPPYNTELDLIRDKSNINYEKHVGSKIARAIIDTFKPDFCLCGHIHENRMIKKLDKTIIANPGPAFEGKFASLDTETFECRI